MSDQDGMISLLVDRFDRFEQRTQTQLGRRHDRHVLGRGDRPMRQRDLADSAMKMESVIP